MARATLEMFLKLTGANKTSQGLDKVSKSTKELDKDVKNSAKTNEQFSAGMSGLGTAAIVGAAGLAAKSLLDFSLSAIQAASSAQEAAGAFGTTFGGAAEQLNKQLAENANLFGLTTSEAQQLISVFGSVAQGIGFTQQESADLSSQLFNLAGDIASFNNITQGAEPVLQAFRSALVGEREALKTYGIAITEAEVQTKAFELTGKNSADALTRQEKALATTALIFERATVQQGNAAREASGFAAQTLIARSATQELREELGEELLPAAGEVLRVFNEIREDSTPALIDRFSDLNLQILGLVSVFEGLRDVLSFGEKETQENLRTQIAFGNGLQRVSAVLQALGLARKTDIAVEKAQEIQTQKLNKQFENYNHNINEITRSFVKNRQGVSINRVAFQKFGEEIDKKLNPIFGEQNSLILTNIQLETDRKKLLDLITSANTDLAQAQRARNQAAKEVTELQIQENVNDAQAAIRKSELLTQISLLTQAQANGVDVTNELNLANAELAEAEFELANDSDRLTLAKERLLIADENLKKATENQEKAIKSRNDALLESIDLTKQQEDANKKIIDQQALFQQFRAFETAPITPISAPVLTPSNDTSTGGTGTQEIVIQSNLILEDSVLATEIQKVNTKTQQQGKTFLIDRLR
tara:strand:- start:2065 stop:4002 length:1938 start_codon:yes stop_codon:yes gene_type:complete